MSSPSESVLTVVELARMLRVSQYTVYEAVRKNQIPHVRLGRRILFHRDAIQRFLLANDDA